MYMYMHMPMYLTKISILNQAPLLPKGVAGVECWQGLFSVFKLCCICLFFCEDVTKFSSLPPPPHSPQPPLSPSFILLFPLKFIHKSTYLWHIFGISL